MPFKLHFSAKRWIIGWGEQDPRLERLVVYIVLAIGILNAQIAFGQSSAVAWQEFCQTKQVLEQVQQKRICEELDIVPEDASRLSKALNSLDSGFNEYTSKWADAARTNENERLKVSELELLTSDARAELDDVLLPFQLKRLKQIVLQQSINVNGPDAGLLSNDLGSELRLTKGQLLEVNEIVKKAQSESDRLTKEFNQKVRELKSDSFSEILSGLDDEQREIFRKLLGEVVPARDR